MLSKKGKSRVVYVVIGMLAVVFVGICITCTYVGTHAEVANPMPAYQSKTWVDEKGNPIPLGSEANPYTILEIVPDKDSATIGYLIDGQEPRSLKSIGAQYNSNPASTDIDENSATGIYKEAFASETSPGSVVAEPDEKTGLPVLTIFDNDKRTIQVNPEPEYKEVKDNYAGEAAVDNKGYSQYGYFYKVASGKGYYKYTDGAFVPATSGGGDFNWKCLGEFKYVGYGQGVCTRNIYDRSYSYNNGAKKGANGSAAYKYEYTNVGDFIWAPGLDYDGSNIYAENSTEAVYTDAQGDNHTRPINEAKLGDKIYMTRTEDNYYEYTAYDITCNDPLLKNLIGDSATGTGFATQVVTVTPAELAIEGDGRDEKSVAARGIIDCADLIIIHDLATGYRIASALDGEKFTVEPHYTTDLKAGTVDAIIERGASGYSTNALGAVTGKPAVVVFDESVYETAGNNCNQLKALYDVYNNMGAKMAYNMMQEVRKYSPDKTYQVLVNENVPAAMRYQYTYKDALCKSNFAYNFRGYDDNGETDDSWFTYSFMDNTKIERENFVDNAFYNLDDPDAEHPDKPSSQDPSMSVATMLVALDRETYGYHQSKQVNILELQPNGQFYFNSSDNVGWIKRYVSLFPWFVGTSKDIEDDVSIDTMATYKFINSNEDLNEKYDMVLVGNKQRDATNGVNGYNDAKMNTASGLAYSAVGDLVTTVDHETPDGDYDKTAYEAKLRYSGNDITKKKYDQLIDFANQAPVIIDDKLYMSDPDKKDDVDKGAVDESSFVYQLARKNTDESFVNKYSSGTNSYEKSNQVKQSMTVGDVSLSLYEMPVEYENINNQSMNYNTQKDAAGNNVLRYRFTLEGDVHSTYGIAVYVDENGNGVFEGSILRENERKDNGGPKEDSEISRTLEIFDETDRNYVNYSIDEQEDGTFVDNYSLVSGHTYTVTKVMPSSSLGLIPWKMEVYKQDNHSVRYGKMGYTRIPPQESEGTKPKITVLQMNLSPNMNTNENPYVCFDASKTFGWFGLLENRVGNRFNQLVDTVSDFEQIRVVWMENKDWYKKYHNKKEDWARDIMNYDMLIIGFHDEAKFTSDEDYLYGFEEFRKAGKPIILTHDLVEDASISSSVKTPVRFYLRDISGQLRKYYDANEVANGNNKYSYSEYKLLGESKKIDYAPYSYGEMTKKQDSAMVGKYIDEENLSTELLQKTNMIMDNSTKAMLVFNTCNFRRNGGDYTFYDKLDRYVSGIDNVYGWRRNYTVTTTRRDRNRLIWNGEAFETIKVKKVNEGKITKYPFALPDIVEVRETHTQNYQLDLEYDDDGDVMVWYDLTGGGAFDTGSIYTGRDGDSRNNYYIYTKGNITYTSVGHANGFLKDRAINDEEIRLFINTMIAAYRTSASDPYLSVTNAGAAKNGNTATIYLEDRETGYDITGINNDSYPIRFKINDDTTNSKIERNYKIEVYGVSENGSEIFLWSKDGAEKSREYVIDSSIGEPGNSIYNYTYDNVKLHGDALRYKIVLTSSGMDRSKNKPLKNTESVMYVNAQLMPMFGLR